MNQGHMDQIRRLNGDGISDSEIGRMLGLAQSTVSRYRREMGLPSHRYGKGHRAKLRSATRARLAATGYSSLVEMRWDRYRSDRWPTGLLPREAQILDALWERGPMTRQEICEAIGAPWRGSRKSLKCKGPHGSYLARLRAMGFVIYLGRRGNGRGRTPGEGWYSLALDSAPNEQGRSDDVAQTVECPAALPEQYGRLDGEVAGRNV